MDEIACADVLQWLRAAVQIKRLAPTPAIQKHVTGCATCQAALLLLAAEATDSANPPAVTDCEHCLEDLPAFVEREREDPAQAIRAYPHVWWHLWTCDACLETYRLTRVLMDAEQRGEITTSALADMAVPQRETLLRLTRQFLIRALPPPMELARVRGQSGGPVVLSKGDIPTGRQFILSVREETDNTWSVIVTVTPPPRGWLVLTLGETVLRARFDAQGDAAVTDIPAALLAAVDGPDLVVGIEPEG